MITAIVLSTAYSYNVFNSHITVHTHEKQFKREKSAHKSGNVIIIHKFTVATNDTEKE